ncbi:tyrosine-protein kinase transmembrane receptor ROR2-like [Orbicella faveolata]|uniref:tyrosine-protein kinase transmembrane receptor ROR2-like n=1 Tax=Orbicella faveolata TaxID=48498 RepID=UPI0009E48EA3|nr:tyrosine-protein kinase transmembrane receptor ROR2-like [Orbicella faveolata]
MCPRHKKTAGVLDSPVILYISLALFGNNFIQTEASSSCIQAEPPVSDSAKNGACIFYNYTVRDGLCKNVITSLYVFGDNDTLAHGEKQTMRFQRFFNMTIAKISEKCKPIMIDLFCRYHFPPCDTSLDKPHARRICRKTCEYMDQDLCKEEMVHVRQAAEAAPVVDKDMINCSLYGIANGGVEPALKITYPRS